MSRSESEAMLNPDSRPPDPAGTHPATWSEWWASTVAKRLPPASLAAADCPHSWLWEAEVETDPQAAWPPPGPPVTDHPFTPLPLYVVGVVEPVWTDWCAWCPDLHGEEDVCGRLVGEHEAPSGS
jgi:hypothetical protein